jgi:hypothetical protein
MPVVEKNDVDISSLFLWSKQSTIQGLKKKDIKIYIRLLGDADINRARVMALRRSAELRKSLRDPESDDKLAFIPDQAELNKDVLVESIIMYTLREITKKAMQDVVIPKPKDPGSDADTERMEKFQKEVDEYPKVREKAIRDLIEKLVAERRKELAEKDEDFLYKQYQGVLIGELCEEELLQRFKEGCVFFGTFKDKKFSEKFFNSYEELDNLPTEIKRKLIDDYSLLEIESEKLKK